MVMVSGFSGVMVGVMMLSGCAVSVMDCWWVSLALRMLFRKR